MPIEYAENPENPNKVNKIEESSRYTVRHVPYLSHPYLVWDTLRGKAIAHCSSYTDAKDICKTMNISNEWEPLVSRSDMKGL